MSNPNANFCPDCASPLAGFDNGRTAGMRCPSCDCAVVTTSPKLFASTPGSVPLRADLTGRDDGGTGHEGIAEMSRIEELRKKLRKKPFDQDFSDFISRVDRILEVTQAASARSTPFLKNMYERYKAEQPPDTDAWIATNVNSLFGSQRKPPVWITEADWCFYNDMPMMFINQFTDAEGVEFYVFMAFRQVEGGERAVYKMLAHDHEGKIILEGEIRG